MGRILTRSSLSFRSVITSESDFSSVSDNLAMDETISDGRKGRILVPWRYSFSKALCKYVAKNIPPH